MKNSKEIRQLDETTCRRNDLLCRYYFQRIELVRIHPVDIEVL